MSKGGYFNNGARRSGGDRHVRIYAGDPAHRAIYLKILKEKVAATGLTGPDLREVYDRLDATETDVLRECVHEDAVGQVVRKQRSGE